MLEVPTGARELVGFINDTVEICRISVGQRMAYCRLMNTIAETGRYDGTKSLINLLNQHLDRAASHLYSPVDLRFTIDFENVYPASTYEKAAVVGKVITRSWERTNTDVLWARGVFEALKYGAAILKQWMQGDGDNVNYARRLLMPWQLGVYNESENELSKQPAICETTTITLPEVWRRIWHLPNAKKLFDRIKSHAQRGEMMADPQSFFHQVLSSSTLNTGVQGMTRPLPGGIVQLNNDPNYSIMGPVVGADVVTVHELWVQDEEDYTTLIMIDPDVVISPYVMGDRVLKKSNLLGIKGEQPYRLIQPNEVTNWLWGRSELVDLIEPQALLSTSLDDFKRLIGLQVDKILMFKGETGLTDELYGQFRAAGYMNGGPNSGVEDLTPKIPGELLPWIKFLIDQTHELGSFPPVMQGRGESGVRADAHADTLLKTASPTLRDRSLLLERQVANAADLTLQLEEAKNPRRYWTKSDDPIQDPEKTSFLITDLPEDWRVTVYGHTSSPIFANENKQEVYGAHKMGIVDGDYVIDHTDLPDKDAAKLALRTKQATEQQFRDKILKENPELGEKLLLKQMGGHH